MISPAIPVNEIERLAALKNTGLLDDLTTGDFDRFTRLAQALFGCKISLFSLIDEKRQWFKSRQGTALKETPRDISFCAHAVFDNQLLYVPDATIDARFANNPLVTGEPAIRLYAGLPLHSVDGFPLGTLCIIDDIPRELNSLQLTLLADLAALAEAEIARSTLTNQLAQLQREKQLVDIQKQRLNAFIDSSRLATWEWNVQTGDTLFNPRWAEIIGYDLHELMPLSVDTWLKLIHPNDKAQSARLLQRHFSGESPYYNMECRMRHRNGHWIWVQTQGKVINRNAQGEPLQMAGTHLDITERKARETDIIEAYAILQRVCQQSGLSINETEPPAASNQVNL
jgi:PAS domain S-box-containing protein